MLENEQKQDNSIIMQNSIQDNSIMMQNSIEVPILKYFAYEHLPAKLQLVSAPFHQIAIWIVQNQSNSAERTAGLRKLLEAKDCIVRNAL